MALQQNNLQLRPFWLSNFGTIRQLHSSLKKVNSLVLNVVVNGTKKVLSILSPSSYSLLGLKNIIKKTVFKAFSAAQQQEESNERHKTKMKQKPIIRHRKNQCRKPLELCLQDESVYKRRYNTRQAWRQQNNTFGFTCSLCLDLDPNCEQCKDMKVAEKICLGAKTRMSEPQNKVNKDICDMIKRRRETLKRVSKLCEVKSPKTANSTSSLVYEFASKSRNKTQEVCPCRIRHRPEPTVNYCGDCPNHHLGNAKSYYVILSSK